MQETPQQYTQRILGFLGGRKPLDILAATLRRIARLIEGVPRKRLSKRPAPDTWNCYGIHSERGKETVHRTIEMTAGHDLNHLKQVKERLERLDSKG